MVCLNWCSNGEAVYLQEICLVYAVPIFFFFWLVINGGKKATN